MRPRIRMLSALLGLAAVGLAPVSAGGAEPASADPFVIEQSVDGTCFSGSVAMPDCSYAETFANESALADDAQMAQILAAGGVTLDEDCGAYFLTDQIVTTMKPSDFVNRFDPFTTLGVRLVGAGDPVPAGFHSYRIAGGGHTGMSLVRALYDRQINHDGPTASGVVAPLYVLTGSPVSKGGPGSMPLPATTRWSSPEYFKTAGANVVVFDTVPTEIDEAPRDGFVDAIAGHGDFVVGIAEAVYGGPVTLVDATSSRGIFTEADIAMAIESYPYSGGEIANLSAGTYACTSGVDDVDIHPMLLGRMLSVLQKAGVHLVAAAGNDATDDPFYPAAYGVHPVPYAGSCTQPDPKTHLCSVDLSDVVTSVGSVVKSSKLVTFAAPSPAARSAFSNYGDWVEAWAVGEHLVSDHPGGPYDYCVLTNGRCGAPGGSTVDPADAPAAHLGRLVSWSGTSFASPQVAGWLAAGNGP